MSHKVIQKFIPKLELDNLSCALRYYNMIKVDIVRRLNVEKCNVYYSYIFIDSCDVLLRFINLRYTSCKEW